MKISVARNKTLELTIINGRDILLKHNVDTVNIKRERDEITEIAFYDRKLFQVNSDVEIDVLGNKHTYRINKIKKLNDYSFELSSCSLTKSSIFLMPLVTGKDMTYDQYFYNVYFYNAYLNFEGMDEYNDGKHLFLVYRFFTSDYFRSLETFIQQHKNFVKTFEPNREFTVYIMEIPLMFQKDSRMICRGKYSNITTTAKSRIIFFHRAHIESELSHILHRSDKLKQKLELELACSIPDEVDLCSRPNLIEETYFYGL